MRLNSRIQQKQDTAANWKSNNPVLLSGEFGYETDTGKVKIGNGSSHWNDIDYVGKDELPTDPTFNSLVVGGGDSSASASGSANLIADEMGVTITKNDSAIDVNENGVDVQSTNIHLAADNGTLSITAGSWPVLTVDNSNGWGADVAVHTSGFRFMDNGLSDPTSLSFSMGLNAGGSTTNFDFSELNINSETTFLYTPYVLSGSDGKVELVDKNYLEDRLENIGVPEVFESLHVSYNDSLSATTLDVTSDGIQAYSGKDVWVSGSTLTLNGDEVVFPNGSNTAMKIFNNGGSSDSTIAMNGTLRVYGNQYNYGNVDINLPNP